MRDRLSLRAEEVEFEELSWLLLLLFSFRALKCWSRKNKMRPSTKDRVRVMCQGETGRKGV